MRTMNLKIAVACTNASGEADMPVYELEVRESDYHIGNHFEIAKARAAADGYQEAP